MMAELAIDDLGVCRFHRGWVETFEKNRHEAALDWWYEMRKGIDESLCAFL